MLEPYNIGSKGLEDLNARCRSAKSALHTRQKSPISQKSPMKTSLNHEDLIARCRCVRNRPNLPKRTLNGLKRYASTLEDRTMRACCSSSSQDDGKFLLADFNGLYILLGLLTVLGVCSRLFVLTYLHRFACIYPKRALSPPQRSLS